MLLVWLINESAHIRSKWFHHQSGITYCFGQNCSISCCIDYVIYANPNILWVIFILNEWNCLYKVYMWWFLVFFFIFCFFFYKSHNIFFVLILDGMFNALLTMTMKIVAIYCISIIINYISFFITFMYVFVYVYIDLILVDLPLLYKIVQFIIEKRVNHHEDKTNLTVTLRL